MKAVNLWFLGFAVTGIAIMVGIYIDPYTYEINGEWVYAGWIWPMLVFWIVTWLILPLVFVKFVEEAVEEVDDHEDCRRSRTRNI